ncbi:MAG: NAD(P)-binding domain-containing protein [Leptospiraceae bacterium]|nr:NAD(P)-binding domain-containing protein [Leptospiraceae bacterium]
MSGKKIGIVGSGPVAIALGNGFQKYGYDVMLGSSDLNKLEKWNGKKGNFSETAKFGEIIILSIKGTKWKEAIDSCGADNLNNKIIIDVNNPIAEAPPENGVLKFFTTLDNSLMELMQSYLPKGKFVKAFSCVGNHLMVDPDFGGIKPSMFICGNDSDAKKDVSSILTQFGWEIEDMGKVEAARAIEPLCILWCIPGFASNSWVHAFKLLKK